MHERHCRATLQAALATFPLHASVGGKALSTPFANLPAVTDVDGCELEVPHGLKTLGEALGSPGTSGPAPLVTLTLRISLSDDGLHVRAALATRPSDRVVALRMLRAMSILRNKRLQCSLNMNRMNMSWYPLERAEEAHRIICNTAFPIGTTIAVRKPLARLATTRAHL